MTPTTRNSVLVGGVLIVIALLLTCGPIRGIFGAGDAGTGADVATSDATPLPPVGAALPVNTDAALGAAATTGAVAGSQIGSADTAAVASEAPESVAPVLVAGAAGAAAEAAGDADEGASVAAASTDIVPPAVSASPPSLPVSTSTMAEVVEPAIALAAASAAAAAAFDDAFGNGFAGGMADMPAEGVFVARFAPPVAAISSQRLALNDIDRAVGIGAEGIRAPCDSPGAGCRRLQVATASPIPINPPIVPGPAPPPIPINPPIVPGPTPPPIPINPPIVSGPTPP